jgi:protein O-GlcNAc transferase
LQQAVQLHRLGRLAEAEAGYRSVLAREPHHFDALHWLGLLKMQQGQLNEARDLVSAAVNQNTQSTEAQSNLGSILAALGRHDEALACFDRVLACNPRDVGARYNRAIILAQLSRFEQALADYDQVVATRPDDAEAWLNRGTLLARIERNIDALASYDRALAIAPQLLAAVNNRGIVLGKLGRHADALSSFQQVLARDGRNVDALNNRAIVLNELDRYDEALASCEQALAVKPDHVDALITRGNILLKRRDYLGAIGQFQRALVIDPNQSEALYNCGFALAALYRHREALSWYDSALRNRPHYAEALHQRGVALAKLGRYADAIASCQQALAADPHYRYALGTLTNYQMSACDWGEIGTLPTRLSRAIMLENAVVAPFVFAALPISASDCLKFTRAYLERTLMMQPPTVLPRRSPREYREGKIKVAYLSADFRRHAVAWLIAELLERHDRARFELIGVSLGHDDGSEMRTRLVNSFDEFHDVVLQEDSKVAQLIYNLKVDIAVDLNGHTEGARMGILARRPAPIQVNYLGYPGTIGADFIDYVIADPIVLPFDEQINFTEKFVHLPDTYQANDATKTIASQMPTRSELGLPEHGCVFCCFNQSYKLTPAVFEIWMRLLCRFDGAVVWLSESNDLAKRNLRNEAAVRGVDPSRLVFAPKVEPLAAHLARLRAADLFLDTLPYNAHTTASDALWAGLPVLTCVGTTFAGRVAASLLHAIGLPELITRNLDEYEALAVKLASDQEMLRSIRDKLERNRHSHPLFDSDRFRRHIEAAYMTMWEIWRKGESPRSFSVEPINSPPPRAANPPR